MSGKKRSISNKTDPVLRRVILLQQALDQGNRTAFARRVHLSPQQLWNYEHTPQPVPLAALTKIKRFTGISWDWLMEGDESSLRMDLLEKIRAVPPVPDDGPPAPPSGRRSRRPRASA